MNAITKQQLEASIKEYQIQQEIEVDIRKVVEEMKHYKQVNKRFVDRLQELGYHAWMQKDYWHQISVSKDNIAIELREYNADLTWEKIINQLDKSNFKEWEEKYRERLAHFDSDVEQLRGLLATITETKGNLKCFDLWKMERDLQDLIRNSTK